MDIRKLSPVVFAVSCLSVINNAHSAVDIDASVVKLRTSCSENQVEVSNCFTDLAELNNWVFNVRNPAPSAASPVQVEIGPGQFDGNFVCGDSGYVTLSGSGMQITVINAAVYPVSLNNCTNMTFKNMTFKSAGLGVQGGGGVTFWHDVEIDASGFYAWLDGGANNNCYTTTPGKHYWFNSRIIGRGTQNFSAAYQAACDESWFFGSEILKIATDGSGEHYALKVARKRGETHVYGGVVRVVATDVGSTATLVPIKSDTNGIVHVHGTGIDGIGVGANTVIALSALTGGNIHANESSYSLSTGVGGTVKRISKDATAHVHAPYVWETHADVPFADSGVAYESVTGYDLSVVTTDVNGAQDHPHLVIYDDSCPSKWFDSTLNQCR